MAKETYYFSHDYNARNDEKILELRAQFGAEGYGIFWMIIESLAESSYAKIDIKLIAGLSVSYGLAKAKLLKIIDFCLSISLLMRDGDMIYNNRLNEHQQFRKERSDSGKIGADKKWKTIREKKEQFKIMCDFFNNTCVRCNGKSFLLNMERSHIIPSYKGGIDNITNWQPICSKCHSSKGPETIDYRIIFSEKNGLFMPNEWLSHSSPYAKERKGKEIKEKEKEDIVIGAEKAPTKIKFDLLKERELIFYETLSPCIVEFGKETLRAFYDYWREPNKSQTKMRWELEKTWDLKLRLKTWKSREPQFSKSENPPQKTEAEMRFEKALNNNG